MNKSTITLKDIESIDEKTVAKILYDAIQHDDKLYQKVQTVLLQKDTKALYQQISKKINSIARGKKFIDYRHSFGLSIDIITIVDDIKEFVQDKTVALALLKKLILTDEKVYARCDDSSGSVQNSYLAAQELYKEYIPNYQDKKALLKDVQELLILKGYGMRDILSDAIAKDILKSLYNTTLKDYISHNEEFGSYTYKQVLQAIAHYLKEPELYIKALQTKGETLEDHTLLDIALEYKAIDNDIKVLEYLKKIKQIPTNNKTEYFETLIWYDEKRGDQTALTQHLKQYYEKTHKTTILKRYLSRFDGRLYEQEKIRILRETKKFLFDEAIEQFIALDAKEMCAEYIKNNLHNKIYINEYTIKNVEKFLSDIYPEIVIELYRVQIEDLLKVANTKNYPRVIKILKKISTIEKSHNIKISQIKSNQEYIQKLIEKHNKKKTFMQLLYKAFPENVQ